MTVPPPATRFSSPRHPPKPRHREWKYKNEQCTQIHSYNQKKKTLKSKKPHTGKTNPESLGTAHTFVIVGKKRGCLRRSLPTRSCRPHPVSPLAARNGGGPVPPAPVKGGLCVGGSEGRGHTDLLLYLHGPHLHKGTKAAHPCASPSSCLSPGCMEGGGLGHLMDASTSPHHCEHVQHLPALHQ